MKHFTFSSKTILLIIFAVLICSAGFAQQSREEIAEKYKWNFSDMYESDAAWREALESFKQKINEIDQYRGTLTESPENLLKALQFNTELSKQASKIYTYVSMKSDIDTREMKYNGMKQEVQQIFSEFGARSAFFQPEILTGSWEKIEGFIEKEPQLEIYRMGLENMFRTKKHTLSEPEERIMALSGMVTGVPNAVFNTFSNAEMPRPSVTLSNGEEIQIGTAAYSRYRAHPNRNDRRKVFETYWNNFGEFSGTYGEMLYGNVKTHIFNARARSYESSLEASLYPNNIPVEVYHSLIDNVNKNLPAFHRYLNIKKRMMEVDTLRYYDLYAPAVKDLDLKYEYDEAKQIILEAMEPLGEEYVSTVEKAFNERWIDVYPSEGKTSGAYSNGSDYDGHPYILLNYNDLYSDVSTLAHELGHTMQSYFSNKTQPYPLADYSIFVAEVASTFNEVLLFDYMLKKIDDDDVKLSLLMNWLDGFKGTLFRQTQFAEFELKIHEEAEAGKPLTGQSFSTLYDDIVKRYYGHDSEVCFIDDYIKMEWAFIPHFYYNFYVYQYSTSFTASISLAEKVLSGDQEALKKYMEFLSAGGSDYSIELLKNAGVDMTSSEPFDKAIEAMNGVMDQIEEILDKKQQ